MKKKTTFLLIHGAWGRCTQWNPIIKKLDALGYDWELAQLRNHNEYSHEGSIGRVTLGDYADDAERALNLIPDDHKVILVGHSMGAAIASILAKRHKKRFSRIVYVSSANMGWLSWASVWTVLTSWTYIMAQIFGLSFPFTRDDAKRLLFAERENPWIDDVVRQPESGWAIAQMVIGSLPFMRLPTPPAPTMVVAAEQERLHYNADKVAWCRSNGARYETLAGSHSSVLQDESGLSKLILEFAGEHEKVGV